MGIVRVLFNKTLFFFNVVLFLSIDVLYYVILHYVSCVVWTPGRVAAAFATANGDSNKIPNTIFPRTFLSGVAAPHHFRCPLIKNIHAKALKRGTKYCSFFRLICLMISTLTHDLSAIHIGVMQVLCVS